MHTRACLAVAVVAVLLGLPAAASGATISFACCSYVPGSLRAAPGEQVTWNGDFGAHPLKSREGETQESWPTVGVGMTFSRAYTNPGVWHYYCAIHGSPDGTQMSGEVTVTDNDVPTASFTSPATAAVGQQVTFDASASSDPDAGQTVSYAWDLDGDGAYDDGSAAIMQRTYPSAQQITVRLRVTDDNADAIGPESAFSVRSLTIEDAPATIRFGDALGDDYVPEDVRITPGQAVSWVGPLADHPLVSGDGVWITQDSGTSYVHQFDDPGRYTYHCDDHGETGTITVTANVPPTASFTAPAKATTGQTVTFDASGSSEPDPGQTLSYDWDLDGDGTYETSGRAPSKVYSSPQTVTVKLRVTDSNTDAVGPESGVSTRQVTIAKAPDVTIAFPDSSGNNAYQPRDVRVAPGSTVAWTGPFEFHPLASNESRWQTRNETNEADGSFAEDFDQAGRFRFYCVFHGSAGGGGMSGTVTVTNNQPPVASFSAPASADSGATVAFDASASTDDHGIAAYDWDLDGNGSYESAGKTVSTSYGGPATVTVRLRVTDGNGDAVGPETATTSRSITVKAPPAGVGGGDPPPSGSGPPTYNDPLLPPGGGGGGGAAPPVTDRVKPRIGLTISRSNPLKLRLRSSEAGSAAITLKAGSVTLATRALKFTAAGEKAVTLKLSRAARKKLRKERGLRAKLAVVVTDPAGNAARVTKTVTVKR